MKYQCLAYMGIAALSASGSVSATPLVRRGGQSVCPFGYTQSVYYVTVTASSTPALTLSFEPTTTLETSSTVTETTVITPEIPVETPAPVESSPAVSESPAPVETSAPAKPITTSTTEQPVVVPTSTTNVKPITAVVKPSASIKEPASPSTTAEAQPTTAAADPTSSSPEETTTTSAAAAVPTKSSSTGNNKSSATNAGSATFYGGNISGGACSFSGYTLPSSLFGTALGSPRWDNAAECGACVAVTGPNGKTIKAMIVDKCPECESNHLDLFQNAFVELADISKGVIDINWSYVSCDIDSPLILKNKEGTSAYWFSMQVVNANEAIVSLEVSTDGGSTWQSTKRSDYNFFENTSGFGTEKVDIRVTGKSGKVVRVDNVGVSSGASVTASGNV
ncbi:putative extracellular cellulase CelA/allergen Asp F7-like [Aspergillus alliaceus]|uniref:putative extracellular cellulase CelA/allergen Asp F7-like n=1 Tax=Petromyces alliaceus TaxID=209559 RepID=UPI0012A5974F|nr:RlpA-like double-psi beta-barrel-protein domain-containing protein-containing protein [Aspergillus alliaceus]KAB8236025.1 RlpA-like double-psi beta-barrel-protein domain-containing protein-containing protein [Aspergillus alliaceus]